MKALREPLWWLIALFIGLLAGLPYSAPLFSRLFPELPRPVYQQESFWALTLDHGWLVVASSLAATAIGLGAGVAVTRPAGSAFRPLVETIAAIGQTFPPVAVLAMAVPVLGFGWLPACVSSHRYCNCLRTLKEGLPDVDAAYRCRLFWVLPSNCLCDETLSYARDCEVKNEGSELLG